MKRSAYERAVEITNRVNYLEDLIMLLINAADSSHKLAAIRKADNVLETTLEISNEEELDTTIRDKFIAILSAEQKELRDEFDRL